MRMLFSEVRTDGTTIGVAHHVHGLLHTQAIQEQGQVRDLHIHTGAAPLRGGLSVADQVGHDQIESFRKPDKIPGPHGAAAGDAMHKHQLGLRPRTQVLARPGEVWTRSIGEGALHHAVVMKDLQVPLLDHLVHIAGSEHDEQRSDGYDVYGLHGGERDRDVFDQGRRELEQKERPPCS